MMTTSYSPLGAASRQAGVQPPAASWGNMLSGAQSYLFSYPWLAVYPGAMIMTTVVAITPDADVTGTATVATQEGTNTLIIFAIIVIVASIAAVLLLARRRG